MTQPTLVVQLQAPRWSFVVTIGMIGFSLGMMVPSCARYATAEESEPEGCDSIVTVSRERAR
jgi:hypothetical protein